MSLFIFSTAKCTALSNLHLVGCHIGDASISQLIEILHNSTTIKELWLQLNNIGQQGAKALSRALKCNTSLLTLSLIGCHSITSAGAIALTNSLHDNSTLNQLELPEVYQTDIEGNCGYDSIKARVKWSADIADVSVVDMGGKEIDGELLGKYG